MGTGSYIRALGFLYLRYAADADTLWTWFSDYLDDPTPIKPRLCKSWLCHRGTGSPAAAAFLPASR